MAASTIQLSRDDFIALVDLIARLPDFEDAAGRRAAWVTPAFQGYDRGAAAGDGMPLQGEVKRTVATKMLDFMVKFRQVQAGVQALGAFLGHLEPLVGHDDATLARRVIDEYGLLPVAERPRSSRASLAGRMEDPQDLPWRSSAAEDVSGLERLKREGRPDWLPAGFLDEGARVKRAVAHVTALFTAGEIEGTGFLIGADLLLTCHHVLFDTKRSNEAASKVTVRLGYESTLDNLPTPSQRFSGDLASIQSDPDCDWAVVRLVPPPDAALPRLSLVPNQQVAVDDRVYILQHPEGGPMQVAMHDNMVRHVDDDVIQYLADTEHGSSGAPVFNRHWQVVGLHRRWVEINQGTTFFRNEAINISKVAAGLRACGVSLAAGGDAVAGSATTDAATGDEGRTEPLRGLVARIQAEGPAVMLGPEEVEQLRSTAPSDDRTYRLRRIADWREPHLAMRGEDLRRFTRLSLLIDKGEQAELRWSEDKKDYQDLAEVQRAAGAERPVLVLLGEPGAGKTTLLRRLELDLACQGLGWVDGSRAGADETEATTDAVPGVVGNAPLTFYLPLAEYSDAATPPLDWLASRWESSYKAMPALHDLLKRPMLLLLDALNEMPHGGAAGSYADRMAAWSAALRDLHRDYPLARVIISCRSLDYSSSLSSAALLVPHVQVKRLDDEQVHAFLACYLPQRAAELWGKLRGSEQLDIYRTPYFLKLLVDQVGEAGDIPTGRAPLFAGFVRQAMQRELTLSKNPLFESGELLHEADRRALVRGGKLLPAKGLLVPGLARLAYSMQTARGAGQQVVIDRDEAVDWLDHELGDDILKAGYALGVLEIRFDDKREVEQLRFNHQLMQEYFAARRLAEQPDPQLVASTWQADKVAEPLAKTLAALPKADPLPGLQQTGWEVTTLLAAALAKDAGAFVRSLVEANLPLAARCATEPGVDVSKALKDDLRQRLIARCHDRAADLRARIDAGKALGEIEDPRFDRREDPLGKPFLLPPLVEIPGGRYSIGATDGWSWERPIHPVAVAPFAISRFPITNAEYACFLGAGGYQDERWWETEDAKAWLRGDPQIMEPAKEDHRARWREIKIDGLSKWLASHTVSDEDWFKWFDGLSEDKLEAQLNAWYPALPYVQPDFWLNARYNNPAQPVVGISWYEARAYCAWLSAQSGVALRLPTEVEWEAAARGAKGRRYAFGDDFDLSLCNTRDGHILATTPIDIYPGGETPEGLVDMTGNVSEWTLSLWGRDRNRIDDRYRYPYRSGERREDVSADAGSARVLRGGSWYSYQNFARAACRYHLLPTLRFFLVGFRVVRASPTPLDSDL